MKKFLHSLFIGFILCSILISPACSDKGSGLEEPETPNEQPDPTPTKAPFKLTISEVTATTARLSISPVDKGSTYYFDLLREDIFEEYNERKGFQHFFDSTVDWLIESNSMTKEQVLQRILSAGDDSYGFTNLKAGTTYYGVAMGIDKNRGLINSDVVFTKFSTEEAAVSDNTFDISVSNQTYTGTSYSVTPTNIDETYVLIAWNKAIVDQLGDEAFIEHCLKSRSDIENYVVTGKQMGTLKDCVPNRSYYLVAFGYEGGLATTPLTKVEFTTKSGGDPALCNFTFEVSDIQYDRAYMKVTPSRPYNVFFWSVVEKRLYEQLSATVGADKAMEAVLEESIAPFAEDFGNIYDALEMISSYGDVSVEGTTYGLTQGTEYIPWAVCIDNDGKAAAKFIMGESFTTKVDNIAECMVAVKGSYSMGSDGLAVVRSTATPDSNCAGYYNVIFQGDLSDASRQSLLNNILRDDYFKNKPVVEFSKCAWGQPLSAIAVGYDEKGNFGEIAIDVFTPTKE